MSGSMNRRDFLAIGAAAAATAGLSACGNSQSSAAPAVGSGKRYQWRLAMVVPKTFKLWGEGIVAFADKVRRMSGGRMDITVYGDGEMVSTREIFDAVSQGQIEMGHSASYYWKGIEPAAVYFTAVPFGLNAAGMNAWLVDGGGQELWDELYEPHNIKPFPCGNTGVQSAGWFNKKIETIDDLQGLKMRIPGLGGEVIAKAGGSPVMYSGKEIFTNLQTGVIDATEWISPYHDYLMGFYKVAKYCYTGGWHEPGSVLELIINRERWLELPEDLQTIISVCAAETDRMMYAQWQARDAESYRRMLDDPAIEMGVLSDEINQQMRRYAEEVLAEHRERNEHCRKIHDHFFAFKADYERYFAASELAFVRAAGIGRTTPAR